MTASGFLTIAAVLSVLVLAVAAVSALGAEEGACLLP